MRHSNKSRDWITDKYFKSDNNRKWIFQNTFTFDDKTKVFTLKKLADIPIVWHFKIKKHVNPFDVQWLDYFELRSRKTSKGLRA